MSYIDCCVNNNIVHWFLCYEEALLRKALCFCMAGVISCQQLCLSHEVLTCVYTQSTLLRTGLLLAPWCGSIHYATNIWSLECKLGTCKTISSAV